MTETSPVRALRHRARRASPATSACPRPASRSSWSPSATSSRCATAARNVTPGYWRAPELTAEAFDDEGFYCSGDALQPGSTADDPSRGFVFDGRIAEDFKLATGTFVSVGPLRAQDHRRRRALRAGRGDRPASTATRSALLVFPRIDGCRALAGLPRRRAAARCSSSRAGARVLPARCVDTLNRERHRQRRRASRALLLLAEPPSIDRGEVTDKGSINQRAVLTHRAALVDAMYDVTRRDPAVIVASACGAT